MSVGRRSAIASGAFGLAHDVDGGIVVNQDYEGNLGWMLHGRGDVCDPAARWARVKRVAGERLRRNTRILIGVVATMVIVGSLSPAQLSSLQPDAYSVMAMGYGDGCGEPVDAVHTDHAGRGRDAPPHAADGLVAHLAYTGVHIPVQPRRRAWH